MQFLLVSVLKEMDFDVTQMFPSAVAYNVHKGNRGRGLADYTSKMNKNCPSVSCCHNLIATGMSTVFTSLSDTL